MKAMETFLSLPIQLRNTISDCPVIRTLLQEGNELDQLLCNQQALSSIMQQLAGWAKTTLKTIVCRFASQKFTESSLVKLAEETGISGAELRAGLSQLRRHGLVFGIHKQNEPFYYFIPEEAVAAWQRLLWPEHLPSLGSDEIHEYLTEQNQPGFMHAMYCLLVFFQHNPITLTKDGLLNKRTIEKLNACIELECSDIEIMFPNLFVGITTYSTAVAILLEIALQMELIHWCKDQVVINAKLTEQWLGLPLPEMNDVLYHKFCSVIKLDLPEWDHFVIFLERLLPGKWYLFEEVIHYFERYDIIKHVGNPILNHISANAWLQLLASFGWMQLGNDEDSRLAFRWLINETGSAECREYDGKLYVQPDFEILVPPDVNYSTRWELAYFTNHQHTKQIGVYKLSQSSVHHACTLGKSIDDCLRFLKANSLYEIPQHVENAMRQWSLSLPSIISLPKNTMGDGTIIKNHFLQLTNRDVGKQNAMIAHVPNRDFIYPFWREIPAIWWKECRKYHASTVKAIVHQAIKWQSVIKLRNLSNEKLVYPKSITEDAVELTLFAYELSGQDTYLLTQWPEIQLIMPGFQELMDSF